MANFYYHLDRTYRKDVTHTMLLKVIRPLIRQGKPIKEYLNSNETSIYLAVTIKGKYYKFRTAWKVKPVYWELDKQVVKQSYHNSFEINAGMTLLKQRVEKRYQQVLNESPNITISEIVDVIRDCVNGTEPKDDPKSFFVAYDEFIAEKKKSLKALTIKKLYNLKNLLTEFEKKNYPIKFKGINSSFEVDLNYFFVHEKKNLNNTTAKHIALLKTFMNWCVEKGIHDNMQYMKFKVKQDACEIIYLTEAELNKLFNLNLDDKPSLDRVRDRFCLACFTGQRHSDIKNFKYSDIQFVDGGYEWWLFQVKGNKNKKVVIPLSDSAMSIIRKYPKTEKKEKVLPVLSSTNANLYIKEACAAAGIDEKLCIVKYSGKRRIEIVKPKYEYMTMHIARKTFVSLSIEKGLSPEYIMEITGHEDYKTMTKYLAISQKAVKNAFNKAWNNGKQNDGGGEESVLRVV